MGKYPKNNIAEFSNAISPTPVHTPVIKKKEKWSHKKEQTDCTLCLSAYKNQLGKLLFVANDPKEKYFRYITAKEVLEKNLNEKKPDEFQPYCYRDGEKRYLDICISSNTKSMGKEYYGYIHDDQPNFVCWKEDIETKYNEWINNYCLKIHNYQKN